jgi:hypothetical protein
MLQQREHIHVDTPVYQWMHLNVHNKMAVFGFLKKNGCVWTWFRTWHQIHGSPPSFVVSALKMISAVAPSWRVVPASDMLDKVCKDPQFKKEVTKRLLCSKDKQKCVDSTIFASNFVQVRSNPYIYTGNITLQTGRELLTASLDTEKYLHEVKSLAIVRRPSLSTSPVKYLDQL